METPLTLCHKKAELQLFVFYHKQKTLSLSNQISRPISTPMDYPLFIFRFLELDIEIMRFVTAKLMQRHPHRLCLERYSAPAISLRRDRLCNLQTRLSYQAD